MGDRAFAQEDNQLLSTICRKAIVLPLNCLDTLMGNQLTINLWVYFWTRLSMFMPVTRRLCVTKLTVALQHAFSRLQYEIRRFEPFKWVLLFQNVLVILIPLHFHMRFTISSKTSVEAAVGILIGIALNL